MKKEKLTIVVLTAVILVGLGIAHYLNNATQFSPEIWKADQEKREEMLNNIVDGNIFLGKSRVEMIELLGEPSEIARGEGTRVVLKYRVSYDKLSQMNLSLNLDLVNDTVVVLYKYYEKDDEEQ